MRAPSEKPVAEEGGRDIVYRSQTDPNLRYEEYAQGLMTQFWTYLF